MRSTRCTAIRICPAESSMEKRGVIEPGRTPPEDDQDKTASDLESHVVQRAADAAKEAAGKHVFTEDD